MTTTTDDASLPDGNRGRAARPGAEAAGGVAPQGDDPTQPAHEAAKADAADADMRAHGFGDHKGASIDR